MASSRLLICRAAELGLVLGIQISAFSSPHDLPPGEYCPAFDMLYVPERFGPHPEISVDSSCLEEAGGIEADDYPVLDLLDLSGLSAKGLNQLTCQLQGPAASVQSNYLARRSKLDKDCLGVDSSTSDLASLSYRGLYCREYLDLSHRPSEDTEQIAESTPIQSEPATPMDEPEVSADSYPADAGRLSATNKSLGPEFFQPLFVIYRLDGKEFVVPSGLARQWNYVPEFSRPEPGNANHLEVNDPKIAAHQLRLALADGLEKAAKGLFELANRLRAETPAESSISHTALTSEQTGLK